MIEFGSPVWQLMKLQMYSPIGMKD